MPEKEGDELGGGLTPGLLGAGSCPVLGLACTGDVPADGEDALGGVAPAIRTLLSQDYRDDLNVANDEITPCVSILLILCCQ